MFHPEDVAVVKGLPPLDQQFPPPIKNEETWADMLRLLLASRLARVERAHGAGSLPSVEVLSSLSAFCRVAPSAAAAPESEENADIALGEARGSDQAEPSGTLMSPDLKAQGSAADVDPRPASTTAPPASVERTTLESPEGKEALKLDAAAEQARREAEDRAASMALQAREEAAAVLSAACSRVAEAEAEAAACRAAVEAAQCQKHELVLQLRRRLTE
ncbi:hypothetical protein H632_c369p0, partial [Helicosporidium sp. ATCC 50920]